MTCIYGCWTKVTTTPPNNSMFRLHVALPIISFNSIGKIRQQHAIVRLDNVVTGMLRGITVTKLFVLPKWIWIANELFRFLGGTLQTQPRVIAVFAQPRRFSLVWITLPHLNWDIQRIINCNSSSHQSWLICLVGPLVWLQSVPLNKFEWLNFYSGAYRCSSSASHLPIPRLTIVQLCQL